VAFATTRPASPLAPGTARLVPGDAAVTVHRGSPTAAADAPLRPGDALTVDFGVAVVQTSAGTISARPGTTIEFDGTSPRITRGDALVEGQDLSVGAPAAQIVVDGIARVRQQLSLEVGVYEGEAAVKTQTASHTVPALRRAVIAGTAGSALGTTLPLSLDATDSWDRRLMGDALELDAALTSRSRGLTNQIASAPAEVREWILATASSKWHEVSPLSDDEPVGELVVAAEIAKAAHLKVDAVIDQMAQRAEGASWGVIAISHGVRTMPAPLAHIDDNLIPAVAAIVKTSAIPVISMNTTPTTVLPTSTPPLAPPGRGSGPSPVEPIIELPVVEVPAAADNPVQGLIQLVGSLLHGLLG